MFLRIPARMLNLVPVFLFARIPPMHAATKFITKFSIIYCTRIKAVLSDDEGMGQKAHRNPACIMPRCTGEDH